MNDESSTESFDDVGDTILNPNSLSFMAKRPKTSMTTLVDLWNVEPVDEFLAHHEKYSAMAAAQNQLIKDLKRHCKNQDQIMQEMKSEIMDLNVRIENESEKNKSAEKNEASNSPSNEEVPKDLERIMMRSSSAIEAADAIKVGHEVLMERVSLLQQELDTKEHLIEHRDKKIDALREKMELMKRNAGKIKQMMSMRKLQKPKVKDPEPNANETPPLDDNEESRKNMVQRLKAKQRIQNNNIKQCMAKIKTLKGENEELKGKCIHQSSRQRELKNIIKRNKETIATLKSRNEQLEEDSEQLMEWNETLTMQRSSTSNGTSDIARGSLSIGRNEEIGLSEPIKMAHARNPNIKRLAEIPFILWLILGLLGGMWTQKYLSDQCTTQGWLCSYFC